MVDDKNDKNIDDTGLNLSKVETDLQVVKMKLMNRGDLYDFDGGSQVPERHGQSAFLGLIEKVDPFVLYSMELEWKKKWIILHGSTRSYGKRKKIESEMLVLQKKCDESFQLALREAYNFSQRRPKCVTLLNTTYLTAAVFVEGLIDGFEGVWSIGSSAVNKSELRKTCESLRLNVLNTSGAKVQGLKERNKGTSRSSNTKEANSGSYQAAFLDIVRLVDHCVVSTILLKIKLLQQERNFEKLSHGSENTTAAEVAELQKSKERNEEESNMPRRMHIDIDEVERVNASTFDEAHEKALALGKRSVEPVILRNTSHAIGARFIEHFVDNYEGQWMIGLTAARDLHQACETLGLRVTLRSNEPYKNVVPVPESVVSVFEIFAGKKKVFDDDEHRTENSTSVLHMFSGKKTIFDDDGHTNEASTSTSVLNMFSGTKKVFDEDFDEDEDEHSK